MVKKIEIHQQTKYTCSFCGKTKIKEMGCGDLALWFLHEDSGWWCLQDRFHCCNRACHQKTEGIERPGETLPFGHP
ncbi:hypothetical protein GW7_17466 [Heterocephalus glaber]|uniref:60S ribosomal protein L37a n=1 Tax=Heterocephalus glaber TaxID=10181 RepID=G5BDK3_HETGA|nr:hypothetical protein GW7_17466 [Heterocephalus glaber]